MKTDWPTIAQETDVAQKSLLARVTQRLSKKLVTYNPIVYDSDCIDCGRDYHGPLGPCPYCGSDYVMVRNDGAGPDRLPLYVPSNT